MVKVFTGDCLEILKTLPDSSVHCCVTSPPYYGLRDYNHDGQIGLEQTPLDYVENLVSVFREVRRVLRDDGTFWLNLGDSYAGHKDCKSTAQSFLKGKQKENAHVIAKGKSRTRDSKMLKSLGFKNKELLGIPWRVAFALQADGWYLRQDIIWHKPNPMPESVKDRCTKAHEYLFLLTKSEQYYFDHSEMLEEAQYDGRKTTTMNGSKKYHNGQYAQTMHSQKRERWKWRNEKPLRNRRSVWSVPVRPYKGAHFATYPPNLITPCILAGCPEDGVVLDPFGGSGTTGGVALKYGRKAMIIEVNPDYVKLIDDRISTICESL